MADNPSLQKMIAPDRPHQRATRLAYLMTFLLMAPTQIRRGWKVGFHDIIPHRLFFATCLLA